MAELEFTSHSLAHVPSSYSWISTKRFRFRDISTDASLLESLIGHIQYADPYAGGNIDERQPPRPEHGPYARSAITVSSFVPSTATAALERLASWATACASDGEPATAPDLARFLAQDLPAALSLRDATVYELPDLRASAEHEWGWVVGTLGFYEFVCIDRASSELTLIVASDD